MQWEPLLLESLWQPSPLEPDGAYIKIKKQESAVDAAGAADVTEAVLLIATRGRMCKAGYKVKISEKSSRRFGKTDYFAVFLCYSMRFAKYIPEVCLNMI